MSKGEPSVLTAKVESMDLEETTIGRYFIELLYALWDREEGFSGKRPFGSSGWQYDIYASLIRNGYIEGELDSDGYVEDFDRDEAKEFVLDLIDNLKLIDGRKKK